MSLSFVVSSCFWFFRKVTHVFDSYAVLLRRQYQKSVTDFINNQWQGHILRCPGQLERWKNKTNCHIGQSPLSNGTKLFALCVEIKRGRPSVPSFYKAKAYRLGNFGGLSKKKNIVPVDKIPTAARIMAGRFKEKPNEISIATLQGLAVVTHAKAIA